LQNPDSVADIVTTVKTALDDAHADRPVVLKLHPDAETKALQAASRAAVDAGADGIVATNTTSTRPEGLEHRENGGLSGRPLTRKSTKVVEAVYREAGDEVDVVGVGGVRTGQDAIRKIEAGASLLQAYTGFVYRGPKFPRLVHEELLDAMDERGVDTLDELVGAAV
jgi:dihydroorotate dehydrogenase